MKKILRQTIIFSLGLLFVTCRDESLNPVPDPEWAPVVTARFGTDANRSFFNFQDLPNSRFEFTMGYETFDEASAEVASIDVFVTYNNRANTRSLLRSYTEFPATVGITAAEAATRFGVTQLQLADRVTFSFVAKTRDGRTFDTWASNICNLARLEGVCSLDAFVLNPAVARTTLGTSNLSFSRAAITAGTPTSYNFALDRRLFASGLQVQSVEVMLRRRPNGSTTTSAPVLAKTITTFPGNVSITAAEAATALGLRISDFAVGDNFTISFTMVTADGRRFSNFGAANNMCGTNFPTNVLHPLNLPIANPRIEDQAGIPPTPIAGTCSLSWAVVQ